MISMLTQTLCKPTKAHFELGKALKNEWTKALLSFLPFEFFIKEIGLN